MSRHRHSDQGISRLAGAAVAAFVSISLFMYMLYDPTTVSRGRGPVAIAGLTATAIR